MGSDTTGGGYGGYAQLAASLLNTYNQANKGGGMPAPQGIQIGQGSPGGGGMPTVGPPPLNAAQTTGPNPFGQTFGMPQTQQQPPQNAYLYL